MNKESKHQYSRFKYKHYQYMEYVTQQNEGSMSNISYVINIIIACINFNESLLKHNHYWWPQRALISKEIAINQSIVMQTSEILRRIPVLIDFLLLLFLWCDGVSYFRTMEIEFKSICCCSNHHFIKSSITRNQ